MRASSLKSLIYRAKSWVPYPMWRLLTGPYWWWYNRARHRLAGALSPRLAESAKLVVEMKDRHQGERCFILGNGPSLSHTDLSFLRNEITFGLNRIYLNFEQMGYSTTYYLAVNSLVIEQCAQEILSLNMPRFVTWRARRWLARDPQVVFIDTDYTEPATFSKDISGRVYEGSTVTYVALQLAYHLGFEQVVLVGVDHSFQATGQPNAIVISEGDDSDHFSPDYFGKGFLWQLPDLAASERAYTMAREAFEADGRSIIDATIDGKLQTFPKTEYSELFK